jgi:hypothetical protein
MLSDLDFALAAGVCSHAAQTVVVSTACARADSAKAEALYLQGTLHTQISELETLRSQSAITASALETAQTATGVSRSRAAAAEADVLQFKRNIQEQSAGLVARDALLQAATSELRGLRLKLSEAHKDSSQADHFTDTALAEAEQAGLEHVSCSASQYVYFLT